MVNQSANPARVFPRRNNFFSYAIGWLFMRLTGWKVEGNLPEIPKYVAAVAPHTTNWDLVRCIASMYEQNLMLSFMAKHTIFKGIGGPIFRSFGGIAIDRRAAHGVVGECVKAFTERDKLILAIAPEGTRSGDGTFKSGFLIIAREAQVPVLLVTLDYVRKRVVLGEVIEIGDQDIEVLRKRIEETFAPIRAGNLRKLGKA
jgi:1-acyl-sn-glycerol-3-phosphate acyltransferase